MTPVVAANGSVVVPSAHAPSGALPVSRSCLSICGVKRRVESCAKAGFTATRRGTTVAELEGLHGDGVGPDTLRRTRRAGRVKACSPKGPYHSPPSTVGPQRPLVCVDAWMLWLLSLFSVYGMIFL